MDYLNCEIDAIIFTKFNHNIKDKAILLILHLICIAADEAVLLASSKYENDRCFINFINSLAINS